MWSPKLNAVVLNTVFKDNFVLVNERYIGHVGVTSEFVAMDKSEEDPTLQTMFVGNIFDTKLGETNSRLTIKHCKEEVVNVEPISKELAEELMNTVVEVYKSLVKPCLDLSYIVLSDTAEEAVERSTELDNAIPKEDKAVSQALETYLDKQGDIF